MRKKREIPILEISEMLKKYFAQKDGLRKIEYQRVQ
jgi:hypothetical protein